MRAADSVAGRQVRRRDRMERALRSRRDHDLVGMRGDPAAGQRLGCGATLQDAADTGLILQDRRMAARAQQGGGARSDRLGEQAEARLRRHVHAHFAGRLADERRQRIVAHETAELAGPLDQPRLRDQAVGAGDSGEVHRQPRRQRALRRQTLPRPQLARMDRADDGVGDGRIFRPRARGERWQPALHGPVPAYVWMYVPYRIAISMPTSGGRYGDDPDRIWRTRQLAPAGAA